MRTGQLVVPMLSALLLVACGEPNDGNSGAGGFSTGSGGGVNTGGGISSNGAGGSGNATSAGGAGGASVGGSGGIGGMGGAGVGGMGAGGNSGVGGTSGVGGMGGTGGSGGTGGVGGIGGSGGSGVGGTGGIGGTSGVGGTGGIGGTGGTGSVGGSGGGMGGSGGMADPCLGVVCNTPPSGCYQTMGTCNGGVCSYPFNDGANCTLSCASAATCQQGQCIASGLLCGTPPPAICANATTKRVYSAGTCNGGTSCSYPFTDIPCAGSCSNGTCAGSCTEELLYAPGDQAAAGGSAIALAQNGAVHLMFSQPSGSFYANVLHLRQISGSWQTEISSNAYFGISTTEMAVDPAGSAHLIYLTDYELRHLEHAANGSWTNTSLFYDMFTQQKLGPPQVDAAGNVHVLNTQIDTAAVSTGWGWLMYYTLSNGSWSQTVADAFIADGGRPSITWPAFHISPSNQLLTAYGVWSKYDIGLFFNETPATTSWPAGQNIVPFGNYNASPDIIEDSGGTVHLFHAGTYYQRGPAATSFTAIGSTPPGWILDVAVDTANNVYLLIGTTMGTTIERRTPAGVWSSKPLTQAMKRMEIDASDVIHLVNDGGYYARVCPW